MIAVSAQAADIKLTEPAVRAFVARQSSAWNAKDATAFAAAFTPDAVFVDQARDSHGGVTPNGRSTLTQATAQARRFFARNDFRETSLVDRVVISADGRTAQVYGREVTRIEAPGKPARTFCAETAQTLVLVNGRLLSRGQTDTDTRCPR
jgi:uncharacterized protein (TIGR02246 family)